MRVRGCVRVYVCVCVCVCRARVASFRRGVSVFVLYAGVQQSSCPRRLSCSNKRSYIVPCVGVRGILGVLGGGVRKSVSGKPTSDRVCVSALSCADSRHAYLHMYTHVYMHTRNAPKIYIHKCTRAHTLTETRMRIRHFCFEKKDKVLSGKGID